MTISTDEHRTTSLNREDAAPATATHGFLLGGTALALAALLVVLGAVMRSNANFAHDEVSRQLAAQRITFKPLDELNERERGVPCLVEYAGQVLTTGEQAKCYADHFIGAHLKSVAGGKTFAVMRDVQEELRAQIAEAEARNDPSVADLRRRLDQANRQRDTLFEGQSNRGLLLTSYGFATLGTKADQAANAAFVAGAALLVAAGLILLRANRPRSG